MSRRLAIALVALSSIWQISKPWWYGESSRGWAALAVVSFVCFFADARASGRGAPSRVLLGLLALAMLAAAAVLPGPFRLGPIAIASGAALWLLGSASTIERASVAAIALGLVHLAQSLVIGLFHWIGPRLNETGVFGPACLFVLRLCGVDVALVEGDLVFLQSDPPMALAPTPNNAGAVHLATAAAGLMLVHVLCGTSPRALARVLGWLVGAGALRFLLLLVVAKEVGDSQLLWWPWFSILTLAPVILCAANVRPASRWDHALRMQLELPAAPRAALPAAALAGLLLVVAAGFHDPGRRGEGRVLVDEHHSDWEWTEQVFDTEWYGEKSTYNYYCWAEFLAKHYRLERGHEPLTPALLARFDTLILKTPTRPYAADEIAAVHAFVKSGGGLLLIGDHTNVFGTGEFLNQIGVPLGLRYLYDSNYDLRSGALSFYEKPALFPHPVTANMPASMLFGGSCTLALPLCGDGAVVGYRVRTLPADYSQRSFFPEDRLHHNARGGAFFQVGALRAGRGRVVAFTDSTIFSNFFIFMRGKAELALGMVEWASRSNRWWWINWVAGSLGVLCAARALWCVRARGLFVALSAAVPGAVLAIVLLEHHSARAYAAPEPHTEFVEIAFDGEHSDFFIPELRLGQEGDKDFDAFYVWVQRVGFVPRKPDRLAESFETAEAIVVLDPMRAYRAEDIAALQAFVERGGAVLVMDDRANEGSTASSVLAPFGIEMSWPDELPVAVSEGAADVLFRGAGTLSGVEPSLVAPDGRVVLGSKAVGRGRVWALANSRVFERANLGYVNMNPNAVQRMLSRFEFTLLRCLVERDRPFSRAWMAVSDAGSVGETHEKDSNGGG